MKRLLAILFGGFPAISLLLVLLGLGLAVVDAADTKSDAKGPKPINLEKLNTPADEDDPFLSSNTVLYYSSNANKGKFDIYVSRRSNANAPWPAGKIVEDIQTKVNDRSCCLTPEGRFPQYLFYATQTDKETNNFDIYFAIKQGPGKDFTTPTPINLIDTPDDELHPWLTADGKQLYFSRKTKEGWRVLVSSRPQAAGANFGKPKELDLPPDFHHVTLTPDGKTMYLQGPLEKKRWGLFHSTATGKDGWSKPEPLDELNNEEGPTGDHSPSLSRDGSLLYFASDRPGGKGGLDLWYVPTAQLTKKK